VVLREVLEFDAEATSGHRVFFIPFDVNEFAVFDVVEHGAGVGTIVGTRAPHDRQFFTYNGVHFGHKSHGAVLQGQFGVRALAKTSTLLVGAPHVAPG
jgi:hypothetical protein